MTAIREWKANRREFLRISAMAAAAGCVVIPCKRMLGAEGAGLIYGVQMYMFRRQAASDLAGVLKAIHDVGFAQVELYPIAYDRPAAELKRMVTDAGLGAVSGHFDYVGLADKLDYAHALGTKYFVCPMLPHDQWTSLAGFRKAAELFNSVGKGAQERGMQLVFHNHDYEFKPMEGSNGWTELMKHTDPKLVKLEFDLYWLTQGGQDPHTMLTRHADRVVLIHMKDRTPHAPVTYNMDKESEHFTDVGKGTIDWPKLLAQAHAQGVRYAFVDQDETAGPVVDSLKASYGYLKTLKV
ncbi:MAG: sugar phosphate isomerase/epimerase [Acidobacteriaceae bacterium]